MNLKLKDVDVEEFRRDWQDKSCTQGVMMKKYGAGMRCLRKFAAWHQMGQKACRHGDKIVIPPEGLDHARFADQWHDPEVKLKELSIEYGLSYNSLRLTARAIGLGGKASRLTAQGKAVPPEAEAYFQSIKTGDVTKDACSDLWAAVLKQVIEDAVDGPERKGAISADAYRKEWLACIEYITKPHPGFREVCDLAGVDYDYVRKKWNDGSIRAIRAQSLSRRNKSMPAELNVANDTVIGQAAMVKFLAEFCAREKVRLSVICGSTHDPDHRAMRAKLICEAFDAGISKTAIGFVIRKHHNTVNAVLAKSGRMKSRKWDPVV